MGGMGRLLFQQLFEKESSTYTYLLADADTREAVIIDPVRETAPRDLKLIKEMDLKLTHILETHLHADHVTGAAALREATGAKIAMARAAGAAATLPLDDGMTIAFGEHRLKVIATPGHTDGCLSYHLGDRVFTGDALMVRLAGRTDFQQGSPKRLYESLQKLFQLPEETVVYPAHDYAGFTSSTIGLEKRFNARIGGGKSEFEFVSIMNGLNLPPPKKLAEAVPANLKCGAQ